MNLLLCNTVWVFLRNKGMEILSCDGRIIFFHVFEEDISRRIYRGKIRAKDSKFIIRHDYSE